MLLWCSVAPCVWLFETPWIVAPPSMELSRQEYWSGVSIPTPGVLPKPGIESSSLASPAWAGWFFTTRATQKKALGLAIQTSLEGSLTEGTNQGYHQCPSFHSSFCSSRSPHNLRGLLEFQPSCRSSRQEAGGFGEGRGASISWGIPLLKFILFHFSSFIEVSLTKW